MQVLVERTTGEGRPNGRANFPGANARHAVPLLVWDGAILSANFCGESRRARFGATASVGCTKCEGGLAAEGAVCGSEEFPPMFSANYCEVLKEPPICEAPLPPRERPLPLPTR